MAEMSTLGQEYSRLKRFHADVLSALAQHIVTPAEGYLKPSSPRVSTDIARAFREAGATERRRAEAAEAREAALREALEKYARHQMGCRSQMNIRNPPACDCGLYELRQALSNTKDKNDD